MKYCSNRTANTKYIFKVAMQPDNTREELLLLHVGRGCALAPLQGMPEAKSVSEDAAVGQNVAGVGFRHLLQSEYFISR